ncbi:IS91 family transposase [Salinispira pacifica]|uniref:IS91 family transposase n=1 Tax=Salinispira pacifica TaxID=1307761 RepID=UPI001B7FBE1C|nr:transposase [Salinispira pacifica]
MAVYIPKSTGAVQSIFKNGRVAYEGYAEPSPSQLARIDTFLGCADWSKGLARIRCESCGYSYFRPFSCKVFHLCPSCDQKRTLLYGEYLAKELLLELPHRQFVFTIPKILRPIFRTNKRLFGLVSKLIFSLLSEYFSLVAGKTLQSGCVVSFQSFGEFARFHPHWHVIVLEGGFTKYDKFVYLPIGADKGFVKVWQAAVLSLLLAQEKIHQERVDMLNSWKHSGFSIDSSTRILGEADREALGQYIVRGATCAEKISYDSKTDTVTWTASPKEFFKGKKEYFRSFEFIDQLMAHLPPRRVQLVRRYGVYAGRVRSKWKDRPKLAHFATDYWHEQRGTDTSADSPTEDEHELQGDVWSRLRKQSWARLLQ